MNRRAVLARLGAALAALVLPWREAEADEAPIFVEQRSPGVYVFRQNGRVIWVSEPVFSRPRHYHTSAPFTASDGVRQVNHNATFGSDAP